MFVWFIKISLSELTPVPTPVPLPSWSPFPPFPFQNFSCPECPTPYPIPPCPKCPDCICSGNTTCPDCKPNITTNECPNICPSVPPCPECPTPYPIPPCPPCPSIPPCPSCPPIPTPWPSPTIIPCPALQLREETFGCVPSRPILQWVSNIYPVSLFLTNQSKICGLSVAVPHFINSIQCHNQNDPCIKVSRLADMPISYLTFSVARIIKEETVTEEILVSCYHPVNQLRVSFSFIHDTPDFNITVVNDNSIYVNIVTLENNDY